jgi:hypothetical protein
MGEDAERQMAMCCEPQLASKNVSSQTTPNRCGRLIYGRPFLCVPSMFDSLEVKVLYPS